MRTERLLQFYPIRQGNSGLDRGFERQPQRLTSGSYPASSFDVGELVWLWERKGFRLTGFSFGAVTELDLKEKLERSRCPGWLHVSQSAGSSIWDTGSIRSNSSSHLAQ
jgi:hypothetical protein